MWTGPDQYEDSTGKLMMLPTDMMLIADAEFLKYVELYAKDEDQFFTVSAVRTHIVVSRRIFKAPTNAYIVLNSFPRFLFALLDRTSHLLLESFWRWVYLPPPSLLASHGTKFGNDT